MSRASAYRLFVRTDAAVGAGNGRYAEFHRGALGRDLVAHQADMLGPRTDELHVVLGENFGEAGVLGEKAVARMHGVGAGDLARREQRRNIEVAVLGRRRTDAHALIGEPHVHGVLVRGRMHGHRRDAEFLARAQHAERDLPPVGDQNFIEHRAVAHSIDHQRLAVLDRLAILDQNLDDRAGTRRGNLIHRLHRFDDDQRLAGLYLAADVDEGPRARRGTAIGGADHRRGDQPGMLRRFDRYRYRRVPPGWRRRILPPTAPANPRAFKFRATRIDAPSR